MNFSPDGRMLATGDWWGNVQICMYAPLFSRDATHLLSTGSIDVGEEDDNLQPSGQ